MITLYDICKLAKPYSFKNEQRYNINGVNFDINGEELKASATNGHLLFILESSKFVNLSGLPDGKNTISLNYIKDLLPMIKGDCNYQVKLKNNIIDAEFPDVSRIKINERAVEESIAFKVNPHYLKMLSQTMIDCQKIFGTQSDDSVGYLTFDSTNTPIKWNFDTTTDCGNVKITIYLMPIKQ